MGCDIHIFVEKKGNERWFSHMIYDADGSPKDYYPRLYDLFAILANVRNWEGNIKPIGVPRNIPIDCSPEYKKMVDEWGDDGHSHSYFTLDELLSAAPKYRDITQSGYITAQDAENLDKNGILPNAWWGMGNVEGQQKRTWTRHLDKGPLDEFCDHVIRVIQVVSPRFDKENIIQDAANYRVCFFFDN